MFEVATSTEPMSLEKMAIANRERRVDVSASAMAIQSGIFLSLKPSSFTFATNKKDYKQNFDELFDDV